MRLPLTSLSVALDEIDADAAEENDRVSRG
jgi:hypothetical protein